MTGGRLYTYAPHSLGRRSAQTAMYLALNSLVRMMAPILVFTAEEIWQNMPKFKKDASITSVHLLTWPEAIKVEGGSELDLIIDLIPEAAKALEEMRTSGQIGSSFDAQINLLTKDQIRYNFLTSLKNDLTECFKVSAVEIEKKDSLPQDALSKAYPDIVLIVKKANGLKCPRCWNWSEGIGKSEKHPLICAKCEAAITEEKTK